MLYCSGAIPAGRCRTESLNDIGEGVGGEAARFAQRRRQQQQQQQQRSIRQEGETWRDRRNAAWMMDQPGWEHEGPVETRNRVAMSSGDDERMERSATFVLRSDDRREYG